LSAVISECGKYRYRLDRPLSGTGPRVAVFMVNPSVADADKDDPTIRRLLGFGQRLNWSHLTVGNVFAYRATDVKELRDCADPVGPDNAKTIRGILEESDDAVAAWGPLAKLPPILREHWRAIAMEADDQFFFLKSWGTAQDGHPRHPLMLSYDTPLTRWDVPRLPY